MPMRTPVLILLDNMLSDDIGGIWNTLCDIHRRLPSVVSIHLPPLAVEPSFPIGNEIILTYLSTYLQTFPHQALVASTQDGSLPLHFAASLGDANLCQIVWQAVSEQSRVAGSHRTSTCAFN
jgi:hypothetical protein